MRGYGRAALVSALLVLALAGQAQAVETVGENFTPSNSDSTSPCYGGNTLLQTSWPGDQYAVRSYGVITAWSFQANGSPPSLRFKVARPAGGDNFTVVGQSPLEFPTANSLNTYTDVSISVQPGDVIGYYVAASGDCAHIASGYGYHYVSTDVTTGVTQPFAASTDEVQLDLSARVEPDINAPETTITEGAPKKTEKTTAKFRFSSDDDSAAFECKKDKKPWKPCSSPTKMRHLSKGKHEFKVRAIDAAGNTDPTPAKDKFEVVG
jgi:hypothetical protein